MGCKRWFEEFKQLSPVTQVTLVVFALVMVLSLTTFLISVTNIITLLVALKMLSAQ